MVFVKFWSHPYQLVPALPLKPPTDLKSNQTLAKANRSGALLKFDFGNLGVGYADLHPWPEFGEESLDVHLQSLRSESPTGIAERAIQNALWEAQARRDKLYLLRGKDTPILSNALVPSLLSEKIQNRFKAIEERGFSHVKIKIGRHLREEFVLLRKILSDTHLVLRLDANAACLFHDISRFIDELPPPQRAKIEYVEDPCPFSEAHWVELRKKIPLALDWESRHLPKMPLLKPCWDVVVVKPSRQDLSAWSERAQAENFGIVVTSAMDHPLGVALALARAQEQRKKFSKLAGVAGLLTLDMYEPSLFNSEIKENGPSIEVVNHGAQDFGLGFTSILESLIWN